MSEAPPPLLSERAGGVLTLTLNRPEKRNALDGALVEALRGALEEADRNEQVRVVALTGAGPDFCSGADLSALRRIAEGSTLENLADADELAALLSAPRRLGKPVVALVRGAHSPVGAALATACDLVLATESAEFGYPEVRIGFVPAMVMAILRRNVSEKRAFELVAMGERIGAAEAERIGLVNRVWADDRFAGEADAYLEELAGRSASALRLTKRLLYHADAMSFEAAIRAGADLNALARTTADTRAGVARFLERDG